jgi:hypothetical protein
MLVLWKHPPPDQGLPSNIGVPQVMTIENWSGWSSWDRILIPYAKELEGLDKRLIKRLEKETDEAIGRLKKAVELPTAVNCPASLYHISDKLKEMIYLEKLRRKK